MERLWESEAELKAIVQSLDAFTLLAAKELGNLIHQNPQQDVTQLSTLACSRAVGAMGGSFMDTLKIPDEQLKVVLAIGLAISQWWEEAHRGNVRDSELAKILTDRSLIAQRERDVREFLTQNEQKPSSTGCLSLVAIAAVVLWLI